MEAQRRRSFRIWLKSRKSTWEKKVKKGNSLGPVKQETQAKTDEEKAMRIELVRFWLGGLVSPKELNEEVPRRLELHRWDPFRAAISFH